MKICHKKNRRKENNNGPKLMEKAKRKNEWIKEKKNGPKLQRNGQMEIEMSPK